jgi:uncharacterized protein (DUF58 family)
MNLPFSGRVRFRDMVDDPPPESDALIPRVESIRSAYLDALRRQQEALADFARQRGWDFMVHGADERPEEPLRKLHSLLMARLGEQPGASAP